MDGDYLVIGAGATGLAFADELLTQTDAQITIVDKRRAPGGHWERCVFVREAASALDLHRLRFRCSQASSITLQMIRFPQLPFSAALTAFLEATMPDDDDEKNAFAAPIRISDTLEEYIALLPTDMQNRLACSRNAAVRDWIGGSRTDGFAKVLRDVRPDDVEKIAIISRLRDAMKKAAQNLPRLLATLG